MKNNGKKGYDRQVFSSLTMVTQFGTNMIVPIFMMTFLGIWIDKKFNTRWWTVILFFVGALAGARNIYVAAMKIAGKPSSQNKVSSSEKHVTADETERILNKDNNEEDQQNSP
ncbi:MAG: AtpZ/AtpI family protein [Lachnospiraceae bacterium]|nr:AtpZ/AtpI family protein [Lachnospiraceae bacterium]